MDKQLRVVKADGSTEAYLHTKVLGTINNALTAAGRADMTLAERLADVVTFHLYEQTDRHSISSSEIFFVIKATLAATGARGFLLEYVGRVGLAKSYGEARVYRLDRR